MYIIAIYDVASERCPKMLKLFRQHLNWIQNSVFEGELSEVALKSLIIDAKEILDESYDSLIIFKNRNKNWLQKEVIGQERASIDQFL